MSVSLFPGGLWSLFSLSLPVTAPSSLLLPLQTDSGLLSILETDKKLYLGHVFSLATSSFLLSQSSF